MAKAMDYEGLWGMRERFWCKISHPKLWGMGEYGILEVCQPPRAWVLPALFGSYDIDIWTKYHHGVASDCLM